MSRVRDFAQDNLTVAEKAFFLSVLVGLSVESRLC